MSSRLSKKADWESGAVYGCCTEVLMTSLYEYIYINIYIYILIYIYISIYIYIYWYIYIHIVRSSAPLCNIRIPPPTPNQPSLTTLKTCLSLHLVNGRNHFHGRYKLWHSIFQLGNIPAIIHHGWPRVVIVNTVARVPSWVARKLTSIWSKPNFHHITII